MRWVIERFREPSTWRGLVWLITAFGVTLEPAAWEYITAIGMALAGLLGILLKEQSAHVRVELPSIDLVSCPADPDRLHADDVPTQPNPDYPARQSFGVRPPIERPLDDHFSGGWGDRS